STSAGPAGRRTGGRGARAPSEEVPAGTDPGWSGAGHDRALDPERARRSSGRRRCPGTGGGRVVRDAGGRGGSRRRLRGGSHLMAGRRAARRTALFLLYRWDLTGQPFSAPHEGELDPFALELAEAVAETARQLDAAIDEAANDWTAERLGVLERNIL